MLHAQLQPWNIRHKRLPSYWPHDRGDNQARKPLQTIPPRYPIQFLLYLPPLSHLFLA